MIAVIPLREIGGARSGYFLVSAEIAVDLTVRRKTIILIHFRTASENVALTFGPTSTPGIHTNQA